METFVLLDIFSFELIILLIDLHETLNLKKKCGKKQMKFFFYVGGLAPPTGAAPLDPTCFRIDDPSRNRLALNGISARNASRNFEI